MAKFEMPPPYLMKWGEEFRNLMFNKTREIIEAMGNLDPSRDYHFTTVRVGNCINCYVVEKEGGNLPAEPRLKELRLAREKGPAMDPATAGYAEQINKLNAENARLQAEVAKLRAKALTSANMMVESGKTGPCKVVSRIVPVEIAVPAYADLNRVAATIESVLQQAIKDHDSIQAYDLPENDLEGCDIVEWENGGCPFDPGLPRKKETPDWRQMTFKKYQAHTGDTAKYPARQLMIDYMLGRTGTGLDVSTFALEGLLYVALGLGGEAGEVQGKIKKILRDDNNQITAERCAQIVDEMGDALWYMSEIANLLGLDLGKIAKMNLEKLAKRKAEGKISGDGDKR